MNNPSTILLSIKPVFAQKIYSREKRYEFRRVLAKRNVDRFIIYETSPVKAITGEVEVKRSLSMPPAELWKIVQDHAGISKDAFDSYFHDTEIACAYLLGAPTRYSAPRSLDDLGVSAPPQSFCYIS